MKLRLLAVGQKMRAWVEAGYAEYANRMPPETRLELVEIPLAQRSKSQAVEKAITAEGQRMLAACGERDRVIALDVRGKPWSTEQLAAQLAEWMQDGRDVSLLVGGPDGLSQGCLERAERRWSLSPLTLPHPLVRILLAEQLYRAVSILKNHPYHRA
jgi:23S rRNA (pseudouridine1915-N3)-methyltransferase